MDKCHMLKELSNYLDNQLSETQKLGVEEHLKECALCSQELDRLKLLSEKLKLWQVPKLDENFNNSVIKEVVRQDIERGAVKMKKKTLAILVPSSALMIILFFVFLGNIYINRGIKSHLRSASDDIGSQFAPKPTRTQAVSRQNHEPYYVKTDQDKKLAEANRRVDSFQEHVLVGRGGAVGQNDGYAPRDYQDTGTGEYGQGSVIVIQPVLPATGQGEMIIRTAQVSLEVEDGSKAYKDAIAICNALGGYLASSRLYKDAESRNSGILIMRIPKDKFLTALDKLTLLGKVENSTTDSRDVQQEYSNLKARLDASMVVYKKMLEALQKKQATIPEAMRLESELTPVLQRIEALKNQLETLNNSVSFTTINLNFHEAEVSGKVLKEIRSSIKESFLATSIKTAQFLVKAVPTILVTVIWAVVLLVAAILVKNLIMRLFKRG